ncbi:MAG: hypothetical protein WKH64_09080 [Chloroflexia bacterium]
MDVEIWPGVTLPTVQVAGYEASEDREMVRPHRLQAGGYGRNRRGKDSADV